MECTVELKLEQFIDSIASIADIRNLDPHNPITIEIEHPTNHTKFLIAASILEPANLGFPIYTTWVVLDSNSTYYKRALKLVSKSSPSGSAIPTFTRSWVELELYADIFSPAQIWDVGGVGEKGDTGPAGEDGLDGAPGVKGDTGPKGDDGPPGSVDVFIQTDEPASPTPYSIWVIPT